MRMKSILVPIILAFAVLADGGAKTQPYKANSNFVTFGGYFFEQKNANANGWYAGVYLDWMMFKSKSNRWTFGPYVVADASRFVQNMSWYSARIGETGGGLVLGFYSDRFSRHRSLFFGTGVGVKQITDKGESSSRWLGDYKGQQKDLLLTLDLNFNLFKRGGTRSTSFPRSQIQVNIQEPITSRKEATWNDNQIVSPVWSKAYYEVRAKQSLYDWQLGRRSRVFCSPKIIGLYSYSEGAKESNYGAGAEISLHDLGRDDFLSVFCMYKVPIHVEMKDVIVIGMNLNLSLL